MFQQTRKNEAMSTRNAPQLISSSFLPFLSNHPRYTARDKRTSISTASSTAVAKLLISMQTAAGSRPHKRTQKSPLLPLPRYQKISPPHKGTKKNTRSFTFKAP